MLIHIYNHVYILKADEPQIEVIQKAGISLIVCLENSVCPESIQTIRGDITALTEAIHACVSVGGRAAVYWPSGADDSALIVVLSYLVCKAGMAFPNAFVLVADRFYLVQFTSPLLPEIALPYPADKVMQRRFFFDVLSQVSYTPNMIVPNLYVGSLGTLGNRIGCAGWGFRPCCVSITWRGGVRCNGQMILC